MTLLLMSEVRHRAPRHCLGVRRSLHSESAMRREVTPVDFVRTLSRDQNGNVAIIFALSIIPCIFLTGMALDFTSATQKRVILNAAADAAALAAVTPTMMGQSNANAITAATNMFNATASTVTAITSVTPTITVANSNGGLTRTVTVSYTAQSTNSFPNVLGLLTGTARASWAISGSSQSTSTSAPNINFYLLLDNSPSMNIAATTAGINTMVTNTSAQGGCAFACHESNPAGENPPLGNPHGEDNYTLAKNLGVVTRIENMASATQSLMTTASTTEAANNAAYEMAIYTFNGSGTSQVQSLTSNLTTAANAASTIDVLEVYDNNWLTSTNDNNDTDTDFDSAMSQINNIMPTPGSGASSSTPQQVLFIVSDGVEDDNTGSCSEPLDGTRCQAPFDTTWCTTVKNRGIRIAVLYTAYLPLPTNSWYNTWISPFQGSIATNMQNCASTGLYFAITTDGDISSAMQALFEQAVATARLTQ
jgi:Flp pilus assembly protein TadG